MNAPENSTAHMDNITTRADLYDLVATATFAVLSEMQELGVMHCDIKPENIMICKNDDGIQSARIIDFGVSSLPSMTCNGYTAEYHPTLRDVNKAKQHFSSSYGLNITDLMQGSTYESAQPDMYALGLTLATILGPFCFVDELAPYLAFTREVMKAVKFTREVMKAGNVIVPYVQPVDVRSATHLKNLEVANRSVAGILTPATRMKYTLLPPPDEIRGYSELPCKGNRISNLLYESLDLSSRRSIYNMVAEAVISVIAELREHNNSGDKVPIHHCNIQPEYIFLCNSDQNETSARIVYFAATPTCDHTFNVYRSENSKNESTAEYFKMAYKLDINLLLFPRKNQGNKNVPAKAEGDPDMYALGLTLASILGPFFDDETIKPYTDFCGRLIRNEIEWGSALDAFNKARAAAVPALGTVTWNFPGGSRGKGRGKGGKWERTAQKVVIKKTGGGKAGTAKKTVYRNRKTGELRVRKMVARSDGKKRASYFKF